MFNLFNKKAEKKEVDQLKQAVQTGFNNTKQDVGKISTWIKHLDSNQNSLKDDVADLREELSRLTEELENVKNILSIVSEKPVFKQRQTMLTKQTTSVDVLNTVQTSVQTVFLDKLSTTERAIVYVLLNSGDMKLSYEDIAAMLGKDKATVRGQINAIKQKSESLIEEVIGENNKKRVYIPEKIKEVLLRSKKAKNTRRNQEQDN